VFFSRSKDFIDSPKKVIALFGMSGIGKTHSAKKFVRERNWFHYSVDYRIASHYIGQSIKDVLYQEVAQSSVLKRMVAENAIDLSINILPPGITALSYYIGSPGNKAKGGIPFEEYMRRQCEHRACEVNAILDIPSFIDKAWNLYGYDNVLCDMSGSFCEVVDGQNKNDTVLNTLARHALILYVKHSDSHKEQLIETYKKKPKPISYNEEYILNQWDSYLATHEVSADNVDPLDFAVFAFRNLLEWREPRYENIAKYWGYVIEADQLRKVKDSNQFLQLISNAIDSEQRLRDEMIEVRT